MVVVKCELKKCENNPFGTCMAPVITIQVHDPSHDLHECYDYFPVETS